MIQVIDNIIPVTAQERLKQIVNGRDFRWYYRRNIAFYSNANFPKFWTNESTSGYTRSILFEGIEDTPELIPYCYQLTDGLNEKSEIRVEKLIRAHVNLLFQNPSKTFTEDSWNSAHTDQSYPHTVMLYYIEDSDGDTFIFNEKLNETFDKFTIKERISPKQGRAVIFNGEYFHASSNPIKEFKRTTINFNFK